MPYVPPRWITLSDGESYAFAPLRAREHQRRLSLRLTKTPQLLDYAPLFDVLRLDPSVEEFRFIGETFDQFMRRWRRKHLEDMDRLADHYRELPARFLPMLQRLPRVPENRIALAVARPPFMSSLAGRIEQSGTRAAPASQWTATIEGLRQKGIREDEIVQSGVRERLRAVGPAAKVSNLDLARQVDLSHVVPVLMVESARAFDPRAGFRDCCERIEPRFLKRHGRMGRVRGARHIVRYRHRTFGYAIVMSRFPGDLVSLGGVWWTVLDERRRFLVQPPEGFDSADAAMAFAEGHIRERCAGGFANTRSLERWRHEALPGGDDYREILVTLPEVTDAYQGGHFQTRNVLAHIRCSLRVGHDGRRVLFLDEVQSDWVTDATRTAGADAFRVVPTPPFRSEWVLLCLKLMLWWSHARGIDGLAWSPADLQAQRWAGYEPPVALYDRILPDEAARLARTLGLSVQSMTLTVRAGQRTVEGYDDRWRVLDGDGKQVTREFRRQAQAEVFADLTDARAEWVVPVMWFDGLPPIRVVPLFGTGCALDWFAAESIPRPAATEQRSQARQST